MKYKADIGTIKGKRGRVVWRMDSDDADELAMFLEEVTAPSDAVRDNAAALRAAAADAGMKRIGGPVSPKDFQYVEIPVIDGIATLPDGREMKSDAQVVRVPTVVWKDVRRKRPEGRPAKRYP